MDATQATRTMRTGTKRLGAGAPAAAKGAGKKATTTATSKATTTTGSVERAAEVSLPESHRSGVDAPTRRRTTAVVHPWHGIEPGSAELVRGDGPLAADADPVVSAFIEIPRGSRAKFELDADTGLVVLDRFLPAGVTYPSMYGEVPQTLCAEKTLQICAEAVRAITPDDAPLPVIKKGDGDPLDIMVLANDDPGTGVPAQGGFVLNGNVRIIGVIWMIDKEEADPKIVGVMNNDPEYGCVTDVSQVPERVGELVRFLESYKEPKLQCGTAVAMRGAMLQAPQAPTKNNVVVGGVSGPALAVELLRASAADYDHHIRPQLA
jgi:inorganic pyrophosphatase